MRRMISIERQRNRANAALRKIRHQFPVEGAAFFAVLERAVLDLFIHGERGQAVAYLNEEMWHCEVAGVDPVWVRDVLRAMGVCFSMDCISSAKSHINLDCDYAWNSVVLPPRFDTSEKIVARPETVRAALEAAKAAEYIQISGVRPHNYGCEFYETSKRKVIATLSELSEA